jgi:hypothetical protein
MSRRYSNRCLGYAVYVIAICVLGAIPARAQGESASPLSSVSALPDSSQSADYVRTHSADYVRKPTDPPKFDPNSQAASSARTDAKREVARPKPQPVRDDAGAVMVPQRAEPKRQTQTALEPGAEPTAHTRARPARRDSVIGERPSDSPRATTPPPAADPVGAERPAATSLSWPSGENTDSAPATTPGAAGVTPAKRWNDPWGEQPAAPRPRPTTGQVDPWADPPVTAPRPQQTPAPGDGTLPPQMESPPETDPPGPSF